MYTNAETLIVEKVGKDVWAKDMSATVSGYPAIEIVTVKGSEAFITLYYDAFKKLLGNHCVEVGIKYDGLDTSMKVSVKSESLTFSLKYAITALNNVLKDVSVLMSDMTIISCGKYTMKVSSDVLEAIRDRMEITYIAHYILTEDSKLSDKARNALVECIGMHEDTCASYIYGNELIVDRYHCPTVKCPIEKEIVYNFFSRGESIISEFDELSAIECEIKGTGNQMD